MFNKPARSRSNGSVEVNTEPHKHLAGSTVDLRMLEMPSQLVKMDWSKILLVRDALCRLSCVSFIKLLDRVLTALVLTINDHTVVLLTPCNQA